MNRKVLCSNITQSFKKVKNKHLSFYPFLLGLLITTIIASGLASPIKSYALNCSYTVSGQDPSSEEVRQYVKTVYAISDGSDAALDVAMQELTFKSSGLNFFGLISKAMKAHEVACYLSNQNYDSAAITAATEATKMAFESVLESAGIGSVLSVAKLGTIPIEWSLNYFKDTAVQIARNNQTKMYIKARFAGISHETIMAGVSNDDLLFESGWLKCVVPAGICFTGLQAVDPVGYTRADVYGVAKQLYESYVAAATFERENKMIGEEFAKGFTPNISSTPEYPDFADEVTFTAAGRAFDEMNIIEYSWDFGDGNTATGKTVTHRYQYPDSYIVTLYAQDSDGQTHQYTASIYVSPPQISVEYPNGYESLARSFSTEDKTCGDPVVSPCVKKYTWDFGDGTWRDDDDFTTSHSYTTSGSYNVIVGLTLDDDTTVSGSMIIFVGPGTRYINGHTIYGNETWYSGGTYVIQGDIIVMPGATLTIQPGTIVKLGGGQKFVIEGTLNAIGTADNPILFTSVSDDDLGEHWGGIYFSTYSKNSVIDHAILRYGGNGTYVGLLTIMSSSVTVSNSVISHSSGYGVGVEYSSPILTGNTIASNNGNGITLDSAASPILEGNTISNNVSWGIYGKGGISPKIIGNSVNSNHGAMFFQDASSSDLSGIGENTATGNTPNNGIWGQYYCLTLLSDLVLTAKDGPYEFGDIKVPQGVTLTIEPGTVVKLDDRCNIFTDGTLIADGTSANPVVFTSIWDNDFGGNTDPFINEENYPTSPGWHTYIDSNSNNVNVCNMWGTIEFNNGTNSKVNHAIIRYGGCTWIYSFTPTHAVRIVSSSAATISNSEISNALGAGLMIDYSSTAIITGNTIISNDGGIVLSPPEMSGSGGSVVLEGNTISGKRDGISCGFDAQSFTSITITGNTITNHRGEYSNGTEGAGINCDGGTITGNTITNNDLGIAINSASINGNTITNNGIGIATNHTSSINGNTITGNTEYGIYYSGTTPIDATNNNWGDPSGPLDDSDDRASGGYYNPNGKGDRVSDNVIYYPWSGLTTALGTITVIPLPESLNASWTLTGPNSYSFTYSDYEGSDATIGYLNPGDYTVTWGGVAGWDQPSPSIQTLAAGDSITITGNYQLSPLIPTPPTSGFVGTNITINGSNFGATQGGGYVDFNGVHGTIVSWTDTQIIVTVPAGATSGCMTVVTDYGISSCMNFTVDIAVKNDFNADGISDILLRSASTGQHTLWYMKTDGTHTSKTLLTNPDFTIVGTGDVNTDGRADILWRNATTGQHTLWFMNADGSRTAKTLLINTSWTIVGSGDMNGDGIFDVLWSNITTGQHTLWYMNADGSRTSKTLLTNADWTIAATGDINGDGRDDILWSNTTTGAHVIWFMNADGSHATKALLTNTAWAIVGTGDFNQDGIDDILWRKITNGSHVLWFMNPDGSQSGNKALLMDTNMVIAATGDYNKDGIIDILWSNTTTGQHTIWYMNDDGTAASTKVILTNPAWTIVP